MRKVGADSAPHPPLLALLPSLQHQSVGFELRPASHLHGQLELRPLSSRWVLNPDILVPNGINISLKFQSLTVRRRRLLSDHTRTLLTRMLLLDFYLYVQSDPCLPVSCNHCGRTSQSASLLPGPARPGLARPCPATLHILHRSPRLLRDPNRHGLERRLAVI